MTPALFDQCSQAIRKYIAGLSLITLQWPEHDSLMCRSQCQQIAHLFCLMPTSQMLVHLSVGPRKVSINKVYYRQSELPWIKQRLQTKTMRI